VKIMGLQYGRVYTTVAGLRYGHLMIMSDQDHDGSHIKGLCVPASWISQLACSADVRSVL
jgi:DNA gyrase/topoisomerase IV subunit B